jgi:hypothetical protein
MKGLVFIKQSIFVFTFLALCNSCAIISEDQKKGIADVSSFYGGDCKSNLNYSISTDNDNGKTYDISISKSDVVEKFASVAELCTSNAAYIFYKDLNGDEKEIKEIKVTLNFNDGTSYAHKYRNTTLDTVIASMPLVNQAAGFIMHRSYDSLQSMFIKDTSYSKFFNMDNLALDVKKIDSVFGYFNAFQPIGFFITKSRIDGRQIIHVAGILTGEKKNSQFSIEFEPALKSNNVLYFSFNY